MSKSPFLPEHPITKIQSKELLNWMTIRSRPKLVSALRFELPLHWNQQHQLQPLSHHGWERLPKPLLCDLQRFQSSPLCHLVSTLASHLQIKCKVLNQNRHPVIYSQSQSQLAGRINLPLHAEMTKYPASEMPLKSKWTTGRVCPWHVRGVCRTAMAFN